MMQDRIGPAARNVPGVKGRVRLWRQSPEGLWLPVADRHNQLQYDWGFLAAQTLGKGLRTYRIAGMYIEFENVADPEDAVTNPAFGREEGIEYYDDLQSSATRDFLRVALRQDPMLSIAEGFEDFFVDGESGNKLTFLAMTAGVAGAHGKTFSDGVNSKICGAALVAMPVFADRTQDVVFARMYYAAADQQLKEASGQVVITWDVDFQ